MKIYKTKILGMGIGLAVASGSLQTITDGISESLQRFYRLLVLP
jgi:hypothetical protein